MTQRASLPHVGIAAALAFAALTPGGAAAQSVGQIASQPARDVGLAKTKIPPLLVKASENPYTSAGAGNCAEIASSIAALTRVLGPDFSSSPAENRRNVAKIGGAALVNSLIPFRGLVREVSGASQAEREKRAAVSAGVARRGYLRGVQSAKGCHR